MVAYSMETAAKKIADEFAERLIKGESTESTPPRGFLRESDRSHGEQRGYVMPPDTVTYRTKPARWNSPKWIDEKIANLIAETVIIDAPIRRLNNSETKP